MTRFPLIIAIALAAVAGALVGASAARGGEIYRYEAPDGSLAFTDSPARIPRAATGIQTVVPKDTRWTKSERAARQHIWSPPYTSYEARRAEGAWAARAEAARRGVEDAAALETLANEIGVGRGAAAVHRENAVRRTERLEDACRVSGCQPGWVR